MRKQNLKLNLWTRYLSFIGLIVSSFFLLGVIVPKFLYADVTVKNLSIDTEARKIVWKEENGKLNIQSVGELREGEVLPDSCRVCVREGEIVLEKDGRKIVVGPGEYYDPLEQMAKKDQTTYVKVAEGRVVFQDEVEQNGKRKPLGEPIVVDKGFVLLRLDLCHNFQLMSIDEFDSFAETAATAGTTAPVASEDEGPPPSSTPCASAPC